MPSGAVYASAQAKSTHEGFYPIVWKSSIFSDVRDSELKLPTYNVATGKPGVKYKIPPN